MEAVQGTTKHKYRILDHKLDNKLLPKAESYCRIVCFLHDEFGKRLNSDESTSEAVLSIMKSRKDQNNTSANELEIRR